MKGFFSLAYNILALSFQPGFISGECAIYKLQRVLPNATHVAATDSKRLDSRIPGRALFLRCEMQVLLERIALQLPRSLFALLCGRISAASSCLLQFKAYVPS